MAEMDEEEQYYQQHQQMRPGGVPAGYFWHTECAKETCKPESQTVQCPPSVVCKHCGIPEHNDQKCPKVGLLTARSVLNLISSPSASYAEYCFHWRACLSVCLSVCPTYPILVKGYSVPPQTTL